MKSFLGDLIVRVGGDSSDLQSDLRKAKAKMGEFAGEARKTATDVAKVGAASLAAGGAIASALVAQSINGARELSNLARVADTSTATLQKLAFGARTVGIEQDKLSDILKDTKDRVGDFLQTGGGPMADFFENIAPKIGVTAEQFRDLSGPQALQLYVDSLEKANLSQSEMTFFMEAVASDATALIPLLRDGGREMNALANQAENLGLVLSDIEVEQMNQAAIAVGDIRQVFDGFVNQVSAELSPVISAMGKQFIGAAEDAGGVGEAAEDSANVIISSASFVVDAIEGIRRTFEIAGKGATLFGLGVQEAALMAAEFILNRPVQAVNELIEQFNRLPGVEIAPIGLSQLGADTAQALQVTRNAIDIGMADIEEILMREMPSAQFDEFIANAREAAKESAAAKLEINGMLDPNQDESAGAGSMPKDLENRLNAIREANATELELLNQKHQEELEAIEAARAQKNVTEEEYGKLLSDTILRQTDELTAIEEAAAEKRKQIAQAEADAKRKTLGKALSDLSTLVNSENRKMFEVGKAAAIANTSLSTYEGAQKAYTALAGIPVVGPALGAAAAGAAIAAGVARVQAINSTSFKGGGSPNRSTSNSQAINGAGTPVAGGGGDGSAGAGQTLFVQGINPGDIFTGEQLIDLINIARENGARFAFA